MLLDINFPPEHSLQNDTLPAPFLSSLYLPATQFLQVVTAVWAVSLLHLPKAQDAYGTSFWRNEKPDPVRYQRDLYSA